MALKDSLTVTLQVALNSSPSADPPTWTTVASNTTKKLRSWSVKRGRDSTLDTFPLGTASFVLDNRDRLFDPLYSAGAYYGKLKPGKRIRLQYTYGATTYIRFDGYIDGWPQTYPSPSVKDALVELAATEGKRLGRNRLRSPWEIEVAADSPAGWWRLGEQSGTAAVDSTTNRRDLTYVGGVTFNSRSSLVAGDANASVEMDDASGQYAQADFAIPVSLGTHTWEVVVQGTSGIGTVIYAEGADPSHYIALTVNFTGGSVAVEWSDDAGNYEASNTIGSGVNVGDGDPHVIAFVYNTATGDLRLFIDGSDETVTSGSRTGKTLSMRRLRIGGGGFTGTVDEVLLYTSDVSSRLPNHATAALAPWLDDTPYVRINRVLDAIDWPASDRDLDTGRASLDSATSIQGNDALSHLQAIALSEGGRLFVSRTGKVTLIGRNEFWTETAYTTSQATFSDDGAGLLYTGFGWDYSDAKVRNEVRINPQSGTELVRSDATSQTDYGPITYSQDTLEVDPAAVAGQAEWLLGKYKDAAFEVDRLEIDPLRSPATLFPVVLAADLGYRYTIERTPQGVGSQIAQDVHLEGTTEAGNSDGIKLTWQLSRAEPAMWIAGVSKAGVDTRPGY